MFGFVADALTVTTTVLFPVFASYKALHTSDPALLAPWLMYFIVLSLTHLVENTFDFILAWVPFWAWMRFGLHFYLILPGSQGATLVYQDYIDPFLYQHEREIDDLISDVHARARSAGLQYLKIGIEWIKVKVLGFPPSQPSPPPSRQGSYAQNLISRFNMPSARGQADLVGLVSQALSGASALYSGNRDAQAEALSSSGTLIPNNIRGQEDRLSYLVNQRQRLAALMQAFDREEDNIMTQSHSPGRDRHEGGLSKSRSEAEFDRIDRDEIIGEPPPYPITPPAMDRRDSQGGWMPWNWRGGPRPAPDDPLAYGNDPSVGRSSGYDRDR